MHRLKYITWTDWPIGEWKPICNHMQRVMRSDRTHTGRICPPSPSVWDDVVTRHQGQNAQAFPHPHSKWVEIKWQTLMHPCTQVPLAAHLEFWSFGSVSGATLLPPELKLHPGPPQRIPKGSMHHSKGHLKHHVRIDVDHCKDKLIREICLNLIFRLKDWESWVNLPSKAPRATLWLQSYLVLHWGWLGFSLEILCRLKANTNFFTDSNEETPTSHDFKRKTVTRCMSLDRRATTKNWQLTWKNTLPKWYAFLIVQ